MCEHGNTQNEQTATGSNRDTSRAKEGPSRVGGCWGAESGRRKAGEEADTRGAGRRTLWAESRVARPHLGYIPTLPLGSIATLEISAGDTVANCTRPSGGTDCKAQAPLAAMLRRTQRSTADSCASGTRILSALVPSVVRVCSQVHHGPCTEIALAKTKTANCTERTRMYVRAPPCDRTLHWELEWSVPAQRSRRALLVWTAARLSRHLCVRTGGPLSAAETELARRDALRSDQRTLYVLPGSSWKYTIG